MQDGQACRAGDRGLSPASYLDMHRAMRSPTLSTCMPVQLSHRINSAYVTHNATSYVSASLLAAQGVQSELPKA